MKLFTQPIIVQSSLFTNVRESVFLDGTRKIDYILVYKLNRKDDARLIIFLDSLLNNDLEIEEASSVLYPDIRFIKIHAPRFVLKKFSEHFEIPLKHRQTLFIQANKPHFNFMRTELTDQNIFSPNYRRAKATMSGQQPRTCLPIERSLIVYNILKRIPFGPKPDNVGIEHLVEKEVFLAAYPMHDGTSRWNDNENEELNDRQLLNRFWARSSMFYKTLPLDVIESYFGSNIALYFAWMSFYIKMLIIPMIVGFGVQIYGLILLGDDNIPIHDVCHSTVKLCPKCRDCQMDDLRKSCAKYTWAQVADNPASAVYAIFMSLWAVLYMILWNRKQSVLVLRWNIQESEYEENDIRPEYENFQKKVRITDFDIAEEYIPFATLMWRKLVTYSIILLMIGLVVATIISIIYFEYLFSRTDHLLRVLFYSSALFLIGTLVLRSVCITFYEVIVQWLVSLEIPKTQTQFDNSYIAKVFIFSFVNNYGALIYLSFIKGRLFTHPGDKNMYQTNFDITTDFCDPSGCILEIHILVGFQMIFMPIYNIIVLYIKSKIIHWKNKQKEIEAHIAHDNIPRWEKDYELAEISMTAMLLAYEEMVVQFGLLTLFAFAFPLGPFFAVIYNSAKVQLQAKDLIRKYRRPQAKRTASIGAWLDVMKFLTFVSVVVNILLISFTSDVLDKIFYGFYKQIDLKGFINFTLSEYKIDKNIWPLLKVGNGTTCRYKGIRHGPDHLMPYSLRKYYYFIVVIKLVIVLLYQHVVYGLNSLFWYFISDTPTSVREQNARTEKEYRQNALSKNLSTYNFF